MSCYLRRIKDVLDEAGIVVTPANKKQIDQAVHQAVGVTYKNCSATWKRLKEDITGNQEKRQVLIKQLQASLR